MDVLVAGMTAEHVLERLTEGVAVITPGDRSDVVLAVVSAHAAEGFPSLSCIILNGGLELHPSIAELVAGLNQRLPIIATTFGTFETASKVAATRGRVTASSQRKIDTAIELMDTHVDTADLLAQLAIPIPTVVTPQMFTYQLLDRARADRKRIVLPEGEDDRILRAAGRLMQRNVAELTILGDEPQIRAALGRTRRRPVRSQGAQPAHQRAVRPVRRAVRRTAQAQGRHRRAGPRDHPRRLVFRHHAGAQRHGRRHGLRRDAHHRAHRPARVRDHQDAAGHHHGVEHLPDVSLRPGARLRRLRDRAGPDVGAARRHRDLVGPHRRAVQHRAAGGDAVLLDGDIGYRRRRRQGQGGNRIGPRARTRPACGRPHPVRRGRRPDRPRPPRCPTRRWRAGRPC